MGAWTFVRPRLEALLGGRTLAYIGRRESATPATGFPHVYRREQAEIAEPGHRPETLKGGGSPATPDQRRNPHRGDPWEP